MGIKGLKMDKLTTDVLAISPSSEQSAFSWDKIHHCDLMKGWLAMSTIWTLYAALCAQINFSLIHSEVLVVQDFF